MEYFVSIAVIGDKDGNFNDIEKVKSEVSAALSIEYSGKRLKCLKEDLFSILENYIPYFESIDEELSEDRKSCPVVLCRRTHVSIQWDRNVDPIIHLYDDRMKILYLTRHGEWDVAEQAYREDREKVMEEGWEIFRKVKHYYMTEDMIDETI